MLGAMDQRGRREHELSRQKNSRGACGVMRVSDMGEDGIRTQEQKRGDQGGEKNTRGTGMMSPLMLSLFFFLWTPIAMAVMMRKLAIAATYEVIAMCTASCTGLCLPDVIESSERLVRAKILSCPFYG